MIKLHHLNKSRSKRIIWLLEELAVDYEIIPYQRNATTFLAPSELKAIHPLGKSPVLEDNNLVIAESGAITEYLIDKYGAEQLSPVKNSPDYVHYLQWLHFAESSAITPLLLKMFIEKDGCKTNFIHDYANAEIDKVLRYFNQQLVDKSYLIAEKLTGADIMMSFIVEILANNGQLAKYSELERYAKQLATHAGFTKAQQVEQQYSSI